jgi:hypothetical protein
MAGFQALASSLRGAQHGAPETRDGICKVSEQNPQVKSHRFVTCTITDNGTAAASPTALGSAWLPSVK